MRRWNRIGACDYGNEPEEGRQKDQGIQVCAAGDAPRQNRAVRRNGSDVGRELTDKGRKQAKAVAKGLAAFKMVPTRIACSSATRARQTCDRMLKVFGDDPKVDYRQSLYEGGVQSVFDELAQTKEKHRTLLVLGHEPTISIACQWLASTESDPTLLDLLNLGMSPASIAVFGSNEPFNQWQLHSGELIALLTAKDFE